jgi:hypothetical protein
MMEHRPSMKGKEKQFLHSLYPWINGCYRATIFDIEKTRKRRLKEGKDFRFRIEEAAKTRLLG